MLKKTLFFAMAIALSWVNVACAQNVQNPTTNTNNQAAELTSCNQSPEVNALFNEFGRTGKMPKKTWVNG